MAVHISEAESRARRAVTDGIEAALQIIGTELQARAVDLCPSRTGRLASSITYATGKAHSTPRPPAKPEDGIDARMVDPGELVVGTRVEYAGFVEFGTGPHIIRPRDKKALWWEGAAHPVSEVHHPGTPADPFFRQAVAQTRGTIGRLLKQCLVEELGRY